MEFGQNFREIDLFDFTSFFGLNFFNFLAHCVFSPKNNNSYNFLGSVETPDSVKRKLAASSHEFNLKDRTFCELFPQVAEKSRRIIDQTNRVKNQQRSDSNSNLGLSDSSEGSTRQHEQNPGFYGAVTNFLVIGGFAAFAFVVQYVIQSLTVAD